MGESNLEERSDILDILQKFGKYQLIQYFFICLPTLFSAMASVNYVFVAGEVDYRCRIPECENSDNDYATLWWPNNMNHCSKPIVNHTDLQPNQCTNESFTSSVTDCKEWIYGSNDTIVSWLNLACDPWKSSSVGTIHSLGMVLGMLIGGWCSDRFGRKPTLTATSLGMVVGTVKTFTRSYYAYIFIELLDATMCGSSLAAALVLIIEISGNDKRVLSGVLVTYTIYTGEALLVGVAMLITYWKTIIYVIYAPSILFIFYISLLNESPRWQVLNNKLNEAKNTLNLIVKMNNINVSTQDVNNTDLKNLQQICNIETNTNKEGYKQVFTSKEMVKRLFVAIITRFAATLIYYGLIVNSVWIPGNKYVNYTVGALMSFFGDLLTLYILNKYGRKSPLIYGYITTGVTCLVFAYVPDTLLWLKLLFYLIGKLLITVCYTGMWAYNMELFPTSVRGSMLGLSTLVSSGGMLLAPLTPAMATISPIFAPVLFFCSAVLASLSITLTPETKDLPLSGTIEEVLNRIEAAKENENTEKKIIDRFAFIDDQTISHHL